MPYVVAASLRIKKKHLSEFTKRVKRHANNSVTREPGCIAFEVSVDKDDPRRFLFYEVYLDEAAFDKHMAYDFLKKHLDVTAPMLDGEVELIGFWNRLAAPNK
ncbi:MAG: putative quinol monooxygenase [Rhodospirillales bacterium]|jgi:quinol monooxygenase YgiN|nr:putative quinol monooxygenase [Rhodospirillales bacterium]MDP6591038.1 putative quinol monooxygenase [Alphaproteobacteria bacterium]MDP6841644.1 putative quinol monooxygenase [Rhodospirillales bacterium]|tara:strand:+ start:1128 stop:1436 length:309 start_codon:yes stop_codon:yes gene_type:complete